MATESGRGSDPAAAPAGLVLFDGPCPLCQRAVRALLHRDRDGRLRFASLEGSTARALGLAPPPGAAPDTLLYLTWPPAPGKLPLARSAAVLAAIAALGGGHGRLAAALAWIPRPVADAIYRFVARRRQRWFGRLDRCPAPPSGRAGRFLP